MYQVSEIQNTAVVCFTSEEAIDEDVQIATHDHHSATGKLSNCFWGTGSPGNFVAAVTAVLCELRALYCWRIRALHGIAKHRGNTTTVDV